MKELIGGWCFLLLRWIWVMAAPGNGEPWEWRTGIVRIKMKLPQQFCKIFGITLLDTSKWPEKSSIRYGEKQIERLCSRVSVEC